MENTKDDRPLVPEHNLVPSHVLQNGPTPTPSPSSKSVQMAQNGRLLVTLHYAAIDRFLESVPIKENATLELNGDGDLILTDFNNSRIWFTNSSRRNVARMYLSYFGNLRLDNATDNPRWQSFDNPANTWVPALAT
ncbi:hypothetical protein LWI28_001268 [Acer negundo]|uniref:Bulb-type lectin domain-containing protein n=1 Tax=Acer negundo TaxID=4023 RepID=A0AAD5J284_ACENE|nr:hypothetical protein LWI28_001268 [Acer negundo]